MKRIILAILTVIAFFFLIGSVGAFEQNTIGFGQLLIQVGISILVEFVALKNINT